MIFYFSGTGNSAWVAQQLAHLTGDQVYDIATLAEIPDMQAARQIGFVFPIYAWGAPEPMVAFAKKLVKPQAFTFGVCTCGAEAGLAMKYFSRIYPLNSSYSLVMPNNYILGSDTDDAETIRIKISAAREELQRISHEILQQKSVYRVQEGPFAGFKSNLANFGFNKFARNTKPFYATSACNGCGLCVQNCPASTIALVDKMPAWGERCYQCMRCIHECPQQAIQYGKATKGRHRYTIRQYLTEDES